MKRAFSTGRGVISRVADRFRQRPIEDVGGLAEFVSTRAAYAAQKSLYEYVKTRMGASHHTHFADETFQRSLKIARVNVYAACLSDLALHAATCAAPKAHATLALDLHGRGLAAQSSLFAEVGFDVAAAGAVFENRLKAPEMDGGGFSESPAALIRWAPVAEELKDRDAEILSNSLRLIWIDVQDELARRLTASLQ